MMVKHAMWALKEIFDMIVQQQRYAEANIVVELTPQRLGVGNIKFTPPRYDYQTNLSTQTISDDLENPSTTISALVPDMAILSEQTNDSTINNVPSNDTSRSLTTRKDITIQVNYRANGAIFPDFQIYDSSLKLLLTAGDHRNIRDSIGSVFSIHNNLANFTISFTPHLFVKGNELSWMDCINSINGIVASMSRQPAEKAWAELDGSIRDGNNVIGWFCIDKGDLTRVNPQDLCSKQYPDDAMVL